MRHLCKRLAHMAETTLTIFKMLTMLTIQREGLAAEPSSSTHGRDDDLHDRHTTARSKAQVRYSL